MVAQKKGRDYLLTKYTEKVDGDEIDSGEFVIGKNEIRPPALFQVV